MDADFHESLTLFAWRLLDLQVASQCSQDVWESAFGTLPFSRNPVKSSLGQQ